MFDLNPLVSAGVEEKDVEFAQLLMVWLAATPDWILSEKDQIQAVQNFKNAARIGGAVVISTRPLDRHAWEDIPLDTLIAYRDGEQIYTGTDHKNEFFETEEKMRLLFLDFANL